jgi:hypothetical protein
MKNFRGVQPCLCFLHLAYKTHIPMRKTILIFCAFFCALAFAQAQSFESSETRDLPSFNKLKSGSIIEVILKQGNTESAVISTKNIPLTQIVTEVRGGELCLELENSYNKYKNIKVQVEVTYKQLNNIKLSGAGSLKSEGTLKAENLSIKLAGAGNMTIANLEALKLTSEISGAGNMTVKQGKTDNHFLEVSGAGSYKGFEVISLNLKAHVSGAGNAQVHATASLEAHVSGAGSLRYKGNPQSKDLHKSGAGSASAAE